MLTKRSSSMSELNISNVDIGREVSYPPCQYVISTLIGAVGCTLNKGSMVVNDYYDDVVLSITTGVCYFES